MIGVLLRLSAMAWYRIDEGESLIFSESKSLTFCAADTAPKVDRLIFTDLQTHLSTYLPSAPAPVNSPVHPLLHLHMPLHTYLLSTHLQIAVTKQIQMTIRDR